MHRRSFLTRILSPAAILPPLLAVAGPHSAVSAEFSPADPAPVRTGIHDDPTRARIAAKLAQDGFVVTGDIRRKGQFVIVQATRSTVPWRLVLDSTTGEIIGRRPLGQLINLQD